MDQEVPRSSRGGGTITHFHCAIKLINFNLIATSCLFSKQSQISANLQIGPTSEGMVRIYVEGKNIDLPLDFEPDEANDIAQELIAAAKIVGFKD